MTSPKNQAIQKWFLIVESDLTTAMKTATEPNPQYGSAMYHCQQAGEKAVKAYLVFYGIDFAKTHDIQSLIELAISVNPTWVDWFPAAESLTPYATKYRYPDLTTDTPTEWEYHQAYKNATNLYHFVLAQLPEETHPPETKKQAPNELE